LIKEKIMAEETGTSSSEETVVVTQDTVHVRGKEEDSARGTLETTILVCQCGGTIFSVEKRTKTAVEAKCTKCGFKTSVKGPVAIANVSEDEVRLAVKDSVVRPEPDSGTGGGKKTLTPEEQLEAAKFTTLRFRVLIEAKNKTIDRALEAARLMNCTQEQFKEQSYQGHALEYVCADFLSGVDPQIVAFLDEMDEEVERIRAEKEEEGKGQAAVNRAIRDAKKNTRSRAEQQLQHLVVKPEPKGDDGENTEEEPTPKPKPKPKKKAAPKKEPVEKKDPTDDGRLLASVKKAMVDYAEEHREETGKTIGMLIGVTVNDAMKRSASDGGFVLRFTGDERLKDKNGSRARVHCWLEYESSGSLVLEFDTEYSDLVDTVIPNPELTIDEVLPADFDSIKEKDQWDAPSFCDVRIIHGK
jgi:hypothetical protein